MSSKDSDPIYLYSKDGVPIKPKIFNTDDDPTKNLSKAERIKQRYENQQQSPISQVKIEIPIPPQKVEKKKRTRSTPKKEKPKPIDFSLEELLQNQSPTSLQRYRNIISSNYDLKQREMKGSSAREPVKRDIEWHLLCDEAMENEMNRDMKSYREVLLFQAGFVLDEGKQNAGLGLLLNLCYIDMNGPVKRGFDSSRAGFAPGILDLIKLIIQNLNLKKEDVHKIFLHQTIAEQAPMPQGHAWELLERRMISEKIF